MKVIITGGSADTHTVREFANAGHDVINRDVKRPDASLPGTFIQLELTAAGEVADAQR